MRKLTLTLTGILFFLHLSATGDSLRYLTAKDTVFLSADDFGNKIFQHTMEPGQTFFSLARFYGLKLDAFFAYNPDLDRSGDFTIGQAINIPIPDSAIVKDRRAAYPPSSFAPVFYVVKHGDTFYRISKHFFKIPLDTLKARNGLENTLMRTGQKLHIGWLPLAGIPDSLQLLNDNPMSARMLQLKLRFDALKAVKKEQFQNGAAYWQREKKGSDDCYALHRSAPVGSVIEITNPMKKRTVYAKVIAPIPDRAYGDDIVVVLSPSVAKLLGTKDAKFFVEVRYFQ
jgi:LysM repeat protein